MRLNDSVHPAARGAVANIGLLFVTLFHLRAKFLQFLRRRFFVAPFVRPGENREYRVRRLRGAHHRITRIRPGNDKSRIIRLAAHRVIACAKRSSHDHRDLRHNGIAHHVHQLGAAANDSAFFCVATDHEPADVLEKNDRQIRLVAVHDEARCFVRAVGINDTAHLDSFLFGPDLHALVGNNSHGPAIDTGIRGHERFAVIGLVFVERIFVDDCRQQIARIVISPPIEADQIVNAVRILCRLRCFW